MAANGFSSTATSAGATLLCVAAQPSAERSAPG
jgi:hypothetical protein